MVDRRSRFGLSSLVLLSVLVAWPVQAATFVVNSTGDQGDAPPNGTCTIGPPTNACTLRAAIEEANRNPVTADIIIFNISGPGPYTITPTSALPDITQPVTIDGTTQPGYAGTPIIELRGPAGGADAALSLSAGSSGSTIRGLNITQYSGGTGVAIRISSGSSNNVIVGNYLGTDLTGTLARGNEVGVFIQGTNSRIGGTTAADRNIISGNTVDGIQIDGSAAGGTNNLVQGDYIGLNAAGTAAVGNANQGVAIFNAAANNTVGGTAVGAGNVISGNGGIGITISTSGATGNVVQGNLIGTNAAGTAAIGNGADGIRLDTSAASNSVGGSAAGAGNMIAYNTAKGVWLSSTVGVGNSVLGNGIFANGALGIDLGDDFVTANDTGDADAGPNNLQNYPVLSAAMTNGAGSANFAGSLNSAPTTTYRVEFFASSAPDPSGFGEGQRYLGFTNVTTNAAGNAIIGVTLATSLTAGEFVTATATDPSNNTSEFGGAVVAVGHLVVTTTADTMDGTTTSVSNLIATPGGDGRISLREAIQATNATAGTDTITFGIPLTDANHRYYRDDGIAGSLSNLQVTTLADLPTPSSPVITNYDADYPPGTARSWYRITLGSALAAITSPVVIDATTQPLSIPGTGPVIQVNGGGAAMLDLQPSSSGSTIRGFVIDNGNFYGIRIQGSSNNVIAGNFVGTNVAGTAAGPGNQTGIYVGGSAVATNNNRVGGTAPADRNVISGNTVDGIQINGWTGGAANNIVQGNYIGVDVTGTLDLGNTNQGVVVFGISNTNNVIGGTAAGAGNVISGNNGKGVWIADTGTTGTLVQGNKIGTNAAGTAGIPNTGGGVYFDNPTSNNTIGGTTASAVNLIAHNGLAGVQLTGTVGIGNSILGNAIYANGALGIDLKGDGVTANDPLDADTGPNDLLNFPLIGQVFWSGGNLSVNFTLDVPAGSYRIGFFKNPSGGDASGFGEGEIFVGSLNVAHPGGGAIVFNHTFPGSITDVITATTTFCTDGATCAAFGSTSEFSNAMLATTSAQADLAVGKTVSPVYPTPVPVGGTVTYTITVQNNGPLTATNVKVIDTMPPGIFYTSAGGGPFMCNAPPASVVTCTLTLPSLAPLAQQSFQIIGQATAPGVQTNRARPTADEPDTNSANDQGTADTLVTVPGTAVLYPTVRSSGATAAVDPANQNFLEWLNPSGPASQITVHRTTAPGLNPCPYETNSGNVATQLAAATRPFVANQKEFFLDANGGGGLTNFTTYCYTIFVDGASPRFISGRPFDAVSGGAVWAFNMGTWSMAPPGNGVGMVHAVANDNVLYAMTKGAAGGKWPGPSPQWIPFGFMNGPSQGRPSTYPLSAGTAPSAVFLTSQDGNVYAINAQLGGAASPAWPPSTIGLTAVAHPSGMFVAFGGTQDLIYAGSRETPPTGSMFFGLRLSDGATGSPGWSQAGGGANGKIGPVHGQPAVDYFTTPPKVYFATRANGAAPDNNTLWCLNAETGAVLWAKAYGDIDAGVSLRGNRLYVATNSGTVLAVDTSSGAPAWTVSGPFVIAPGTEGPAKGFVYAPPGSNELFFASTSRIWSLSDGLTSYVNNWAGGVVVNSPATPIKVPGETLVYVGSGDGTLQRRDAATGAFIDVYFLGDFSAAVGSPTFDLRNGFIYVGTEAGIIYALNKTAAGAQCVVSCTSKPYGTPCSSTAPANCLCTCDGFGNCVGGC